MADTGFHACGTAVSIDKGLADWVNPAYAQVRDITNLAVSTIPAEGGSDWLRATNFGLDVDVPEGATIDGIIVRINRKGASVSCIIDFDVYLWNGSTIIGSDKAAAGYWPISLTDKDYGTSSDKWGATLTATLIRSSTFGIQICVSNDHLTLTKSASIDVVEMCVYYTLPTADHRKASFFKMF